jgi:hypothetical protein
MCRTGRNGDQVTGPQHSYQRLQADWLGPKEALGGVDLDQKGEREGNYDRAVAIA